MCGLNLHDVADAARRIAGRVRQVPVIPGDRECLWLALEYMQHTGSLKARGAQNFLAAHREAGALPETGVTIASGGNAGLACAWAARAQGVRATVFLPATAPAVKVARLRGYGAILTGRSEIRVPMGPDVDSKRAPSAAGIRRLPRTTSRLPPCARPSSSRC